MPLVTTGSMVFQEEADSEVQSLQKQLEKMQEVQGQLESTAKALQGRTELQEEELEVAQTDVTAKERAGALQQALTESQTELPLVCLHTQKTCMLLIQLLSTGAGLLPHRPLSPQQALADTRPDSPVVCWHKVPKRYIQLLQLHDMSLVACCPRCGDTVL